MSGEYPEVTIPDTHVRSLVSQGSGQEYRLLVALPEGYDTSDREYPTLYLTDADLVFGMVTQNVRLLSMVEELPQLLIVGIGVEDRDRDYVPAGWGDSHDSNAAADFLQFIRDDLVPLISTDYRAHGDDRALVGHSLPGLFGLYVLFSRPDTFNRYVIGSPWMLQEDHAAFRLEQQYADTHTDLPARIFFGAGGLDTRVS